VTLKDSVGATAGTITDDFGNYSFGLGAMRFPLMLKVETNIAGTTPLFSAALNSGVANITPLTTLQVFEAVGRTDPSEIYNSGDFAKLRKSSLDQAKSTVTSNLTAQYAANGLDFLTHDLITSPFVANHTGADAILDQINVAIIEKEAIVTDSKGQCFSYGPENVMTLAIDGINGLTALWDYLDANSSMSAEYVKNSLAGVCVPGIDQLRPFAPRPFAPNFPNPRVMESHVTWTRIALSETDTNTGVAQLIAKLREARARNELAIQRGGKAGPINIVAHSWGSVIAYIALSKLAKLEKENPNDPTMKFEVANLITMGSPIQYLSDDSSTAILRIGSFGLIDLIQASVPGGPDGFRAKPIVKPSNVGIWTNFWNNGDIISSAIGSAIANVPVNGVCPVIPSSLTGTCTASLFAEHRIYFDVNDTLLVIRNLTSAVQLPAPTTPVSPPASTTPAPPPPAFSLTAGTPYCDTRTPVGPAVNLAWSASNGAVYYRVFRNDSGIGVNLVASQLSFINNRGLVAGQTYSYKVQATNANGATWSTTAQVTIPADVCGSLNFPSASFQATPTTSSDNTSAVSLSWSPPVGAQGSLTYEIKRDGVFVAAITDRTSFRDSNLVPGKDYTYTIVAIDGASRRSDSLMTRVNTTVPGGGGSTLAPDLRVLNGAVSPASVSAGGAVSVNWTLANQGTGTANASTTVVRINQSSTNAGGTNLASFNTPSLVAGGSQPQATNLSAPTTAGTYYVWVLADNFSTSGQSASADDNDIVLIGSFIRQ
jgi:hypothetical protein